VTFTKSLTNLHNKVLAIDIDGTICTEERTFERPLARPLPGALEALHMLKRNNNTLVLWTGRGWEQYKVTKEWLDSHGFPYDQILMGKPIVDMIVDDRGRRFLNWSTLEV
jgi:uncharacterized HAD superfamily protein